MTEFKLPELGENIDQGDLVRLLISPGASVNFQAKRQGFADEFRKKELSSWKPAIDWNAAIQLWKPRCLATSSAWGL